MSLGLNSVAILVCTVMILMMQIRIGEASCGPYCDRRGVLKDRVVCNDPLGIYCCGSRYERYCCGNPDEDVSHMYPPVSKCPPTQYTWWIWHWRAVTSILVTLILILFMGACCYYCFGGRDRETVRVQLRRRIRNFRGGESNRQTTTDDISSGIDTNPVTFNPSSPHAFQPPAYDSLPKDPPKYADIFQNRDTGRPNSAYVEESNQNAAAGSCGQPDLERNATQVLDTQGSSCHRNTEPEINDPQTGVMSGTITTVTTSESNSHPATEASKNNGFVTINERKTESMIRLNLVTDSQEQLKTNVKDKDLKAQGKTLKNNTAPSSPSTSRKNTSQDESSV